MGLKLVGGTDTGEGEGGRGVRAKRQPEHRILTDAERQAINRAFERHVDESRVDALYNNVTWKRAAFFFAGVALVALVLLFWLAMEVSR